MTIFYCLTVLGAFRPPLQRYINWNSGYTDKPTDSPLIQHRPYRKWRAQQFFYCWVCIRCCGNLEPLPSNVRGGMNIQTHRLMGGIYDVRRWDELRCRDIHTKFHKDLFRHSKVDRGDTQIQRQHGDRISLLLLFRNKESRLKSYNEAVHILRTWQEIKSNGEPNST
jgi:hypothetical protein